MTKSKNIRSLINRIKVYFYLHKTEFIFLLIVIFVGLYFLIPNYLDNSGLQNRIERMDKYESSQKAVIYKMKIDELMTQTITGNKYMINGFYVQVYLVDDEDVLKKYVKISDLTVKEITGIKNINIGDTVLVKFIEKSKENFELDFRKIWKRPFTEN